MVQEVIIGSLSIGHDLPQQHSKAPYITAEGELLPEHGFGSCLAD
jgi:hypothetical protein